MGWPSHRAYAAAAKGGAAGVDKKKKKKKKKKVAKSAKAAKKEPEGKKKTNIILIKDVPNVGVKGEEVKVAKGYARNYLFVQKLAVYSTEENRKLYEAERASFDPEWRTKVQQLAKAKRRLSKVQVIMKRHVVRQAPIQVLHAPVTVPNILEKLWLQHRIELSPAQVSLPAPLTKIGTFSVPVQIEDLNVPLTVVVQPR